MNRFIIDVTEKTTPFPHVWEGCVGSCHAAITLREDWRRQLKKCREELGFQSVRFHGLFDDRMNVYTMTEAGPYYNFYNIDLIYDYLLELGMKPFVELSFMPEDMASGTQTAMHYKSNVTPPAGYERWAELIGRYAGHMIERYGIEEVSTWFFEVWNEPNLSHFWGGTREEYFRLYQYTAQALKKADPRLRVGGPATAKDEWIAEMIAFCESNRVPLDFISTHHYPTDVGLGFGHPMEERMAKSKRGVLREKTVQTRRAAGKYPLLYTEWSNSPGNRDPYHDMPYAAAFVVKTLADNQGLTDMYAFWACNDIFEEMHTSATPFHGCFGLMNLHGVPKPTYRAFQLLHGIGTERLPVEGNESPTLEVLAVKKSGTSMTVIAYNHNIPLAPIKEEEATIILKGMTDIRSATLRRVDEEHGNARKKWLEMGSPEYLNKEQIQILIAASEVKREPVMWEAGGEGAIFNLPVPPHGIAAITVEL